MIDINFNNKYDIWDASFEIILMLAGAFIIGFLFSYFFYKKRITKSEINKIETDELKLLKKALENCINEKAEIKKTITIEYSEIIEDYKQKLLNAREDLEKCLADKASKNE
ncbi:MAG: hypothetical protein HUU47_07460 [Bacteroidetes bacterium]|nr:hypothetical protein [Bacteroidota bacterium]